MRFLTFFSERAIESLNIVIGHAEEGFHAFCITRCLSSCAKCALRSQSWRGLRRTEHQKPPLSFPVVGVMECSHKLQKKPQLCAPSVASFVLQLPDGTSSRPQSLPKDIAVSDLLPETIPFRLRTD